MKETSIVRKIDDVGRIVLPKQLRRILKIKNGTELEILVDKDTVVLRKIQ
ncbi:AbrB/MazE/SpoVT family DNA-binding domain-containing protein [Ethanoligenens sp.]